MIWINGEPTEYLSASDRGVQYGDGFFETIAVRGGTIPLWQFHRERLIRSAQRLSFLDIEIDNLEAEIRQISNGEDCLIKLTLTRGEGARGYAPAVDSGPTRIISRSALPEFANDIYEHGVEMALLNTQVGNNPTTNGLKTLNRLDQVIAAAELAQTGQFEGLMRNLNGHWTCGTRSNLFVVRRGSLQTPSLAAGGVEGSCRAAIIAEREVEIVELSLDNIESADEVFVCNAVMGVCPVRAIGQVQFDAPGPITESLRRIALPC